MIPEGIVALNDTASAALELADGTHDFAGIVEALRARFDDTDGTLSEDVRALFDEFVERGFIA
jgi:coenzyme PQQ biosynthesis protein PqqD